MLAISIHQPAASLLVHGWCRTNERRWATGQRGPILIHASDSLHERDWALFALPEVSGPFRRRTGVRQLPDAPRGAVAGLALLVDCVPTADLAGGYHALSSNDGRVNPGHPAAHWLVFSSMRPIAEPVCCKGDRDIFEVSPWVEGKVRRQIERLGPPWTNFWPQRQDGLSPPESALV